MIELKRIIKGVSYLFRWHPEFSHWGVSAGEKRTDRFWRHYAVVVSPGGTPIRCSCPDHSERGRRCKHMREVDEINIYHPQPLTSVEGVLEVFAETVGKPLARMADPSYWACEDRSRADTYAPMANAARWYYHRVKTEGKDAKAELVELRKVIRTGIEANAIDRLLERIP